MPRSHLGGSYMVPDPLDFDWEVLEGATGLPFTEAQRTAFVSELHRLQRCLTTVRRV